MRSAVLDSEEPMEDMATPVEGENGGKMAFGPGGCIGAGEAEDFAVRARFVKRPPCGASEGSLFFVRKS